MNVIEVDFSGHDDEGVLVNMVNYMDVIYLVVDKN